MNQPKEGLHAWKRQSALGCTWCNVSTAARACQSRQGACSSTPTGMRLLAVLQAHRGYHCTCTHLGGILIVNYGVDEPGAP